MQAMMTDTTAAAVPGYYTPVLGWKGVGNRVGDILLRRQSRVLFQMSTLVVTLILVMSPILEYSYDWLDAKLENGKIIQAIDSRMLGTVETHVERYAIDVPVGESGLVTDQNDNGYTVIIQIHKNSTFKDIVQVGDFLISIDIGSGLPVVPSLKTTNPIQEYCSNSTNGCKLTLLRIMTLRLFNVPLRAGLAVLPHFIFIVGMLSIGTSAITQGVTKINLGVKPSWIDCFRVALFSRSAFIGCPCLVSMAFVLELMRACFVQSFKTNLFLFLKTGDVIPLVLFTVLPILVLAGLVLYMFVIVFLNFPAITIEKIPIPYSGGFQRANSLAQGWWREILILYIPCLIVLFSITTVLRQLFLGSDPFTMHSTKGIMVYVVPEIISLPLLSTLETVVYFNLRIRKKRIRH